MRIFLAIVLSIFSASCTSKSYPPQAHIDIRISTEYQASVINATKRFGMENGFEVFAGDDLPKQGRFVSQVLLKRHDGVMVVVDNFLKEDTLNVAFYAKQPDADWNSVKEAWLKVVTEALAGHGEITEVPVRPRPSAIEKKEP